MRAAKQQTPRATRSAKSRENNPPAKRLKGENASAATRTPTKEELLGAITAVHRRDSLSRASTRKATAEELLRARMDSRLRERIAEQEATIAALQAELEAVRSALVASDAIRRKALEQAQLLSGKISVYVRLRPATQGNGGVVVTVPEPDTVAVAGPKDAARHRFNGVFGPTATQLDVFNALSQHFEAVLDGRSTCVLAYGATASGKTYTIFGSNSDDGKQQGIVLRALRLIFASAERLRAVGWTFAFKASFLEVYNETLVDLLDPAARPVVRHDARDQPQLCGVVEREVSSAEAAFTCLQAALAERVMAATQANSRSSRSHVLFRLRVDGFHSESGSSTSAALEVVDLAGSEKFATSSRTAETTRINQSLSTLTQVIRDLAERRPYVRFRDSVLTHLLQGSLSGRSKVVLLVALSPDAADRDETISSLRFADEASNCAIKPKTK